MGGCGYALATRGRATCRRRSYRRCEEQREGYVTDARTTTRAAGGRGGASRTLVQSVVRRPWRSRPRGLALVRTLAAPASIYVDGGVGGAAARSRGQRMARNSSAGGRRGKAQAGEDAAQADAAARALTRRHRESLEERGRDGRGLGDPRSDCRSAIWRKKTEGARRDESLHGFCDDAGGGCGGKLPHLYPLLYNTRPRH